MNHINLPKSDEDLLAQCEVQTYRASGKGGQHVNKTNSAVRLIYLPCKLAITCQEGRSQHSNLMRCVEKLREKVEKLNYRQPKRVATRMSRSQKERNLEQKAKHSQKKQRRGKYSDD